MRTTTGRSRIAEHATDLAAEIVRAHPTAMNVLHFASEAGVHPAIVAGRVRFERNNYRLLSRFVGSGEVKQEIFNT